MKQKPDHNVSHVSHWDIIVHVKTDLRKKSPMGQLTSRHVAAVVLQHLGYQEEVLLLMQQMSHCSRAFIHGADGLQGILKSKTDRMIDAIEQVIEKDPVLIQQKMQNPRMVWEINSLENKHEQYQFLKQSYPNVFAYTLTKLGRLDLIKKFKKECKDCKHGNGMRYSQYIHGYWLPWLAQKRQQGHLIQGK